MQPNLYSDVAEENLPAMDEDDTANNGRRVIESLDTLLLWCALDPVDTWEMEQNDLIQDIQGNRNVFIDYSRAYAAEHLPFVRQNARSLLYRQSEALAESFFCQGFFCLRNM